MVLRGARFFNCKSKTPHSCGINFGKVCTPWLSAAHLISSSEMVGSVSNFD